MWRPWFSGWPTRPRGTGLADVHTPTLLIVGGHDPIVLALNRHAQTQLATAESDIAVVPGATHLFEEPGALPAVADLASAWFVRHFTSGCTTSRGVTIPSQLRSLLRRRDDDLLARFRELAPATPTVAIQRWSLRRVVLTMAVVAGVALALALVVVNLRLVGLA